MAVSRKSNFASNQLLFNIGGAALLVAGFYYAMQMQMSGTPETPLCEARYGGGVLFSYTRNGTTPLVPEDLQSRVAGTDRGLIKNTQIVADSAVALGHALEVQLNRSTSDEDDQSRSGVNYSWSPRQMEIAKAACLSYSVWVPDGFSYGDGGVLPGIGSDSQVTIAPNGEAREGEGSGEAKLTPFSLRPQWLPDSNLILWHAPNMGLPLGIPLDPAKAQLRPGQWTRIEMEMALNTPGKTDGTLRAWVNGKIVMERHDVGYRRDEIQNLQSVLGDVHHVKNGGWAPAPTRTRLRLSPLELRLR